VFVRYAAYVTRSLMFDKLPCTDVFIDSTMYRFVRMIEGVCRWNLHYVM